MEKEQRRLVVEVARARAGLDSVAGGGGAAARQAAVTREAQQSRERAALRTFRSAPAGVPSASGSATDNVVSSLMTFCQKTKVDLETSYRQHPSGWTADLIYESVLRRVEAAAVAATKAEAKKMAAADMLRALREVS